MKSTAEATEIWKKQVTNNSLNIAVQSVIYHSISLSFSLSIYIFALKVHKIQKKGKKEVKKALI